MERSYGFSSNFASKQMIFIAHIGEIYYKGFVLKQSLKEIHSFAPSFNLRHTNTRRANLRRASGDPPSYFLKKAPKSQKN